MGVCECADEELEWDPEELTCREPAMSGWLMAMVILTLLLAGAGCVYTVRWCCSN